MEEKNKKILVSLYVSKITRKDPIEVFKKYNISKNEICIDLDNLRKNGLVKEESLEITHLGIESLKIVLAGGVFDIIHPGHIHTLNSAKNLGDLLVVVIATDNTAVRMKKRKPLHSQDQRKLLVESLEIVDLAIVGHEGDIFKTVDMIRPKVIALGYDQAHQEKFIMDGCKRIDLNASVARLQSPIPEVSSSIIEKEYGDEIHGT